MIYVLFLWKLGDKTKFSSIQICSLQQIWKIYFFSLLWQLHIVFKRKIWENDICIWQYIVIYLIIITLFYLMIILFLIYVAEIMHDYLKMQFFVI